MAQYISDDKKQEIIRQVREDACKVSDLAREYSVSAKSIYTWLGDGVKGGNSALEITYSASAAGKPWQNGFQESFYNNFKLELGDISQLESQGQLLEAIAIPLGMFLQLLLPNRADALVGCILTG